MKIIKHGCVIHFICPVCGCEFLMSEDEEGCYKPAGQEEKKGGEEEYLAICPDCGEGEVPGHKEQKGEQQEKQEEPQEEKDEPKEPDPAEEPEETKKEEDIDFVKGRFPSI